MRTEFISSLEKHLEVFAQRLDSGVIGKLADYFELVMEHNPILHLVGPCSPGEFATRHVLESLTLLEHLPVGARFADVGTGAGLPSIPCLIARPDLSARLIESKEKKSAFLQSVITELDLVDRAEIDGKQFEESSADGCDFVTCRALDKLLIKLPRLLKWSRGKGLLFFGGESLGVALQENGFSAVPYLMPLSERRFLFVADAGR